MRQSIPILFPSLTLLPLLAALPGCLDSIADETEMLAELRAATVSGSGISDETTTTKPDGDDDDDNDDDGTETDPEEPVGPIPLGFWKFDDCSSSTRALLDSSENGLHAVRTANVGCAEGTDLLGTAFANANDGISVIDNPLFTFEQNLAFSLWIFPTNVANKHVVLQRGNNNHESFSLSIHDKKVDLRVEMRNGTVANSLAPIKANRWQHVAGLFNGQFIFLFVDGQQVGQVAVKGKLRNPGAPLRIGRASDGRAFKGRIDEVWMSTDPTVTANDLIRRACIVHEPQITVQADPVGPVEPDTVVTYHTTVTNKNFGGGCPAVDYFFSIDSSAPGINVSLDNSFVSGILPGKSAEFTPTITGSDSADPGAHAINFTIFDAGPFEPVGSGVLNFELAEPTGCHVKTSRELMITNLSVVEDSVRTSTAPSSDPSAGVWTFQRLIENMAPTPAQAPEMVEALLDTWLTNQTVNGLSIPTRSFMRELVLDQWPRLGDGRLDLSQSPMRLLAIVNRFDLRDLSKGQAGEGRFVFGVTPNGFQQQFTVILEYRLPAHTEAEVQAWADQWHALGALEFPSAAYNDALQAITDRFAGRNADPLGPNGSALNQLRSNEIALSSPWELREFNLSADTGFFKPVTVKLSPANQFDRTDRLARYVNANESAILLEKHDVPELFEGTPFLGASSFNNIDFWSADGITNNEARHKFSLNTCNGCHGAETGTGFLQIFPRDEGQEAFLTGFLTGTVVSDPITGEPRQLNDLKRRKDDLTPVVCPVVVAGPPSARAAAPKAPTVNLRKGISRVH